MASLKRHGQGNGIQPRNDLFSRLSVWSNSRLSLLKGSYEASISEPGNGPNLPAALRGVERASLVRYISEPLQALADLNTGKRFRRILNDVAGYSTSVLIERRFDPPGN